MKRYSKEWWFQLATRKNAFWKEVEGFNYPRYLTEEQKFYCFKRYAEAYHREKIEEEVAKLKIADGAAKYWADVGATYARNHILGIIESLKLKDVDVKADYGQGVRHGYEILYDALIEKIKGYESI